MTAPADKKLCSVLFVCNQNAVRSPMAEALAKRHFRRRLFVDSVGLIAGTLDPFSVAAMAEEKLDIANHAAKTVAEVDLSAFSLIIALTPESRDYIRKALPDIGDRLEYWATPDPSDAEGNRNQVMDSYRLVRDHLECRIADRFPLAA